jgi:hypothetical protein
MELTIKIVLILHFIGIASLLGGFLTQMSAMKTGLKVVPAILHGSWLLLITGFALTGLAYADTLRASRVPVELEIYRGVTHDFIKMGRFLPEAERGLSAAALALKAAFA